MLASQCIENEAYNNSYSTAKIVQLISTFVGVFTSFCINNQEQGNELKGIDNKTFEAKAVGKHKEM